MTTVIEKCALAMDLAAMDWAEAPGNELEIAGECPSEILARAVLLTLIENIDEGMVGAGVSAGPDLDHDFFEDEARAVFTAMIKHALEGKG